MTAPSQLRSAPPHRRHVPRPRGPAPPRRGCCHGAHVGTAGGVGPLPCRLSPFRRGHCGPAGGRCAHSGLVVAAAGGGLAQALPTPGNARPWPGHQSTESRAARPGPTEGGWAGQTTRPVLAKTGPAGLTSNAGRWPRPKKLKVLESDGETLRRKEIRQSRNFHSRELLTNNKAELIKARTGSQRHFLLCWGFSSAYPSFLKLVLALIQTHHPLRRPTSAEWVLWGVLPGCFEGRLPPHTRIVSVSRQYPNSRHKGRNLMSVQFPCR